MKQNIYEQLWEDVKPKESNIDEYKHRQNHPVVTSVLRAYKPAKSKYNDDDEIDEDELDYLCLDERITERSEFIRFYILSEHATLLTIPIPIFRRQSIPRQMEETLGKLVDVSAFNTYDFSKSIPEFNKARYAQDKIKEAAKDMAMEHSCITNEEGKQNMKCRFINLVNDKYRNKAMYYAERIKQTKDAEVRFELKLKLAEANKRIIELNCIWQKHAYSD